MKYVERVGVERKKRLAFLLAALLLPEAVFAAAEGNDLAMGNAVEYQYSSHITGDRWMHDETTLYFNDGFGRLIEFHLTVEHQMTELSIRQNGCVVWRGQLPGADRFSVVREESMGEVYFLISSGEKEYARASTGTIDGASLNAGKRSHRTRTLFRCDHSGLAYYI